MAFILNELSACVKECLTFGTAFAINQLNTGFIF